MSVGYKDFLSSPFFPRYGSLTIESSPTYSLANGSVQTYFTLSGHLIVKGWTITFESLDNQILTQLRLAVDGTTINIEIAELEGGYYPAYADALGVKILRTDPTNTMWTVGSDKEIIVGSQFEIAVVPSGLAGSCDSYASVVYYPVE